MCTFEKAQHSKFIKAFKELTEQLKGKKSEEPSPQSPQEIPSHEEIFGTQEHDQESGSETIPSQTKKEGKQNLSPKENEQKSAAKVKAYQRQAKEIATEDSTQIMPEATRAPRSAGKQISQKKLQLTMAKLLNTKQEAESNEASGAAQSLKDASVQAIEEAEAKLGGQLRMFQDQEDLTTNEISARLKATTDSRREKEMWHHQVNEACGQQRRVLDTKHMWEPILRASAGEHNQQEVAHQLTRNQNGDRQRAAQQIEEVIEEMTRCNAIEVSRVIKAMRVWCAGDGWRSQQGNQLKDVLKLCNELHAIRPPETSTRDILEVCNTLEEQQDGTRPIPYAIGYARMTTFAGKDAMKALARTCETTAAAAGQKASSSERHNDQHGKGKRKRARKSDEPPKGEQRPTQDENEDERDQEARNHFNATHLSGPSKKATFHM